jgi:hypothetical protein
MTSASSGSGRVVEVEVVLATVVVLVEVGGEVVVEVPGCDVVVVVELLDGDVVEVVVVVDGMVVDVVESTVVVVVPGGDVVVVVEAVGVQVGSQPSPATRLPSSQISPPPASRKSSPHTESTASKRKLNRLALSFPRRRVQASRNLASKCTLPVRPSQASHLALSFVTPLRLAANFLGGRGAHRSSMEVDAPIATTAKGASGRVTR